MLNSLRTRLVLSQTLTLFLIVPLMGLTLIYVLESQVLLPDISRELREQAQLVVQLTEAQPEVWNHPDEARALVARTDPGVSALLMLLDRNGNILASTDPADAQRMGSEFHHPGLANILAGQISEHQDYSPRLDGQIADIFIPVKGPDRQVVGVVRMAHHLVTVSDQFSRLRYFVAAVLGLTLILGVIAGLILALRLERPLREVTRALNRLAIGQELAALPERGPTEIRVLVHAFNVLMNRLRALQESRRQLLANTVHELSTPLGALNSGVQALQEGADEEPELRRELLQGMSTEVSRLKRLLDELMNLYDQVLGDIKLERKAIALGEWLPGVLSTWREATTRKGLQWRVDISPQLPTCEIDPDRMSQVVGNLLSNAIKYTDRGGTITVTAMPEKDAVRISIADTGRGIAPDEQEKIFVPFYRGRHAGRFPEGMGLGLPIARELAQAHGGRLEVKSTPGWGSTFTLWLPAHTVAVQAAGVLKARAPA